MNHEPFHPLDDCPLGDRSDEDKEEAQRHKNITARLEPTADCITRQLKAWLWNRNKTNPNREAPRIGLFGGLGQGKSTVLNLCLAELKLERETRAPRWWITCHDWLFGPPIVRFDVSHVKAEDLEWRFLTAVLWQRIRRAVWWFWLPLSMISASVLAAPVTSLLPDSLMELAVPRLNTALTWLASGVIVPLLAAILSSVYRATKIHQQFSPAANLHVSRRDWSAHVLADLTGTLPRVVIVDDLDRAKVDQQRAFLRAILRFSRQMHFAVVVCMDESAVLASKPDPEAPEELLRKTIQLELHLPDRSREDIAFLTISLCSTAASINPSWRALLLHPQWIGDLVRCLLLQGPIGTLSPRRIKHFLNAVMARVVQLNAHAVDDCCALLRLEGLLTLLPELRRHPGALLNALETNRVEAFEQILSHSTTSSDNHPVASRYFAQTRSMQPATHDGWFSIISGSSFKARDSSDDHANAAQADTPLAVPADLRGRSLELLRLMSMAIDHLGQGYPRSLHLSSTAGADPKTGSTHQKYVFYLTSGSDVLFDASELPVELSAENVEASLALLYWPLWLGALAQTDLEVRNRLYRCMDQWLPQIARHNETHQMLSDLLSRERLADHEVWSLLPQDERRHLLETTYAHATLVSHRLASSALQDDELEDAMARYLSVSHRNAWRDAKWLSAQLPVSPSEKWPADLSALLPVWPSWFAAGDRDWFGCLRSQIGHELPTGPGTYKLPHRLAAAWRVWGTQHLGAIDCLDILLAATYSSSGMYWSLPRLAAWLDVDRPDHAPAFQTRHPEALKALLDAKNNALDWSAADFSAMTPLHHLTAIAVAYHCDWRLTDNLADKLTHVPNHLRRSLVEALLTDDSSASKWLPAAGQNFIITLLDNVCDINQSEDNMSLQRWRTLISDQRPSDADKIFAALRWTPPRPPLP